MKSRSCILIVDDEADVILFLSDRLNAMGYKVLTAANGKEGLDVVQHQPINGILLDVFMPVMGGILMLEHLGQISAIPPVIVMSATEHRSDLQLAIAKGARDFLLKPIASDQLTRICAKFFH